MFNMSEYTANMCPNASTDAIITGLKTHYLQDPTSEEITIIERRFASAGFPGCIGCVDCAGWTWK